MVVEVTAGRILRRGTDGMRPSQLQYLLDNAGKVDAILDEIEARRAVFLKTEAAAKARLDEAEKAGVGLLARETVLVEGRADLEADIVKAEAKHRADMAALNRRTGEVTVQETAAIERATALDAREQEIEDRGRAQEEQHRGRLEAVEAQEAAAEERDQALVKQSAGLDQRQNRLQTVAKMVKQAAASLE